MDVPLIRTRKRRVVASHKRKKALFSCDRCKTRKIACKRDLESATDPCTACQRAGIECQTTIQRKKKLQGPIENIGLHYKCLVLLVQGLCPDIDVNNIDSLIEYGVLKNIKMPPRTGLGDDDDDEILGLLLKLTSGRPKVEKEESQLMVGYPLFCHPDNIIIDQENNLHYCGSLSAPLFLKSSMGIMSRRFNINLNLWPSYQNILKGELLISSKQEPLEPERSKQFPYLYLLDRADADKYVDVFFEEVHPRFLLFNEATFRQTYDQFWLHLLVDQSLAVLHHGICCIYMVWILGKLYRPVELVAFLDLVVRKYINIVKMCLLSMLLTPTLDGIRCCMMLSMYMDNDRRRESGYILLELAARQAISMGLNKQRINECVESPDHLDEMKRVWWTLFSYEICFSSQMGRRLCFSVEDISIDYPRLTDIGALGRTRECFVQLANLSKFLSDALEYRCLVMNNHDLLSDTNMRRVSQVRDNFGNWFLNLDLDLSDIAHLTGPKLQLHLRYHYGLITLTFPFLLYICSYPRIDNANVFLLINLCLQSAAQVAEIAALADEAELFNGTIFSDVFIMYHALMALVMGYVYMKTEKTLEFSQEDVRFAASLIKGVNSKNAPNIKGLSKKISCIIDMLINGLTVIDEATNSTIAEYLRTPKPVDEEYDPLIKTLGLVSDSSFRFADVFEGGLTLEDERMDFAQDFVNPQVVETLEFEKGYDGVVKIEELDLLY